MPCGPEHPEPGNHPLEGVLDHLLARERGALSGRQPQQQPRTAHSRRMLVIAALGPGEGFEARASLARRALEIGRRPAALDIGCVKAGEEGESPGGPSIPLASIPCGPDRLRGEPAEVVGALMQRLRRHESAADLLLVRIPPAYRMTLMRAAFIAGGLVLPLGDSNRGLHEALRLSREAAENFIGLPVWPHAGEPSTLERYQAMVQEFLEREARPFNADSETLEKLNQPPDEGFVAAMLSSESSKPPPRLLQLSALKL
jgi:hypothetical protein